jgi:hypothetical protein
MLSVVATSARWGTEFFGVFVFFAAGSWTMSESSVADDGEVKIALKV